MTEFIDVKIRAGEPVTVGNYSITPFAQSIRLKFPGFFGGLIWNRPVSILAKDSDGTEQVIPIQDVTRQAIWTLCGVSLLVVLFTWLGTRKARK